MTELFHSEIAKVLHEEKDPKVRHEIKKRYYLLLYETSIEAAFQKAKTERLRVLKEDMK